MNFAFESFETLSRKHVNGTIHTHIPDQARSLHVGIGTRMDIYRAYSYVAVKLAVGDYCIGLRYLRNLRKCVHVVYRDKLIRSLNNLTLLVKCILWILE